jgi:hypothetical protein
MKKHYFLTLLMAFLATTFIYGQTSSCCDYYDSGQNPGIEGETFGIALGDIDNDGDVDAVTVDAYDDMEVYVNDGTGSFTYDETYGSGESWFGVYLVDVDMDEDLDIIVAAFYSGNGCEVWKNNGSGSFTMFQGGIASSLGMEELGIGDVNGDGSPDIFAPGSSGGHSEVWLNDGSGNFSDSNQDLAGSSCTQAVLVDLDGDNDLDAFVSRTNGAPNMVWINNGTGMFTDSGQELGSAFSTGADAADVDMDGDMDIVVSNWQVPSQVWLNDGSAGFTAGVEINNNNYAKSVVCRDIDYDCDVDVVLGSYGSPGVQVWGNDGAGNFTLCFTNDGSLYAHDIAVADLNGDLMPDIWAGNFSSSDGDFIFMHESLAIVYDTVYLCQDDSVYIACGWQFTEGDFLQGMNCDTLSWFHISEVVIDTAVAQSNDTLYAQVGYMNYQWFNCENMEAVPGANDYYFLPEQGGSYAVEITEQSCVDTSSCHLVQFTGLNENIGKQIIVSPNPATSFVQINAPILENRIISLFDLTGRKLIEETGQDRNTKLDISKLQTGIYLLKIEGEAYTVVRKLVKE